MTMDNAIYVDGRRVRLRRGRVRAAPSGIEDTVKAHQHPKWERYEGTLFLVLKFYFAALPPVSARPHPKIELRPFPANGSTESKLHGLLFVDPTRGCRKIFRGTSPFLRHASVPAAEPHFERADSNRLPLLQLRVIIHTLQGFAQGCKCRISKPYSFLRLAVRCTVLRSRWCQSGVKPCHEFDR